tara:strand:+ start:9711 stop:10352 length:642 start_codon:yes stop_codon:yes gene_type:complete
MIHKLSISLVAALIVTGCASKAPEILTNTYSYDSKQHSGTVEVNERIYSSSVKSCDSGWREKPIYQSKGIPSELTTNLHIQIDASYGTHNNYEFEIPVPYRLKNSLVVIDEQKTSEYMLGTEVNGIVAQGDLFYAPEGYVVRVGQVEIDGWLTKACIGIDRMYILDSDLVESTDPIIHLDRVVVPFASKNGADVDVSFGSAVPHKATIRAVYR